VRTVVKTMRSICGIGSDIRVGERGSPARGGSRSAPGRGGRLSGLSMLALAAGLGFALSYPRPAQADICAGFQPSTITVAPGETFTATISILQADAEFNAFDASVRFDPAMLGFLPAWSLVNQIGPVMSSVCGNTFHRFDPAPDSLKITLSLLCGGTFVTGPGAIYRVQFVAGDTPGTTTVTLGPFTEFYRAGIFARPLHRQELTVTIQGEVGVGDTPAPGGKLEFAPPAPNPSRGSGGVRLEFVLPGPDVVGLQLLDIQGRRIATRAAESFGGGRHHLTWALAGLAHGDYLIRLQTRSNGSAVQPWAVLR